MNNRNTSLFPLGSQFIRKLYLCLIPNSTVYFVKVDLDCAVSRRDCKRVKQYFLPFFCLLGMCKVQKYAISFNDWQISTAIHVNLQNIFKWLELLVLASKALGTVNAMSWICLQIVQPESSRWKPKLVKAFIARF